MSSFIKFERISYIFFFGMLTQNETKENNKIKFEKKNHETKEIKFNENRKEPTSILERVLAMCESNWQGGN